VRTSLITGRREKELKEPQASSIETFTTSWADVSRLEDLDRLYAVVKEKHGHIDILFANAGAGQSHHLKRLPRPFRPRPSSEREGLFFYGAEGPFPSSKTAVDYLACSAVSPSLS